MAEFLGDSRPNFQDVAEALQRVSQEIPPEGGIKIDGSGTLSVQLHPYDVWQPLPIAKEYIVVDPDGKGFRFNVGGRIFHKQLFGGQQRALEAQFPSLFPHVVDSFNELLNPYHNRSEARLQDLRLDHQAAQAAPEPDLAPSAERPSITNLTNHIEGASILPGSKGDQLIIIRSDRPTGHPEQTIVVSSPNDLINWFPNGQGLTFRDNKGQIFAVHLSDNWAAFFKAYFPRKN